MALCKAHVMEKPQLSTELLVLANILMKEENLCQPNSPQEGLALYFTLLDLIKND